MSGVTALVCSYLKRKKYENPHQPESLLERD
jgi:hypothetical protein